MARSVAGTKTSSGGGRGGGRAGGRRKGQGRQRGTKAGQSYPADAELMREMDGYLRRLARIGSARQIRNGPPGWAGIFLEAVPMEFLARHGEGAENYQAVTLEYSGYVERTKAFIGARQVFCRALAVHPTSRALALLALGRGAVKMLEKGMAPSGLFNQHLPADYNRHHIIQKSARPLDRRPINHLSNLVLINTGATGEWRSNPKSPGYVPALDPRRPEHDPERAQRPEMNAHHLFHGAILVSQTEPSAGAPRQSTVYCPRPAFPIFPPQPPLSRGWRSREEVYRRLETLEPGCTQSLPSSFRDWADKLVAFSEACDHEPYEIPKRFHAATRAYTRIYEPASDPSQVPSPPNRRPLGEDPVESERDRSRSRAARNQECLAASLLPPDARVNGRGVREVLKAAAAQGQIITHRPLPLVPRGWRPLDSYQATFPSLERVRQNMREVGLTPPGMSPPHPPRAAISAAPNPVEPFLAKIFPAFAPFKRQALTPFHSPSHEPPGPRSPPSNLLLPRFFQLPTSINLL